MVWTLILTDARIQAGRRRAFGTYAWLRLRWTCQDFFPEAFAIDEDAEAGTAAWRGAHAGHATNSNRIVERASGASLSSTTPRCGELAPGAYPYNTVDVVVLVRQILRRVATP
jgi:hypothetical protein